MVLTLAMMAAAAAQVAPIEVVATTPQGAGLAPSLVAAPVQTASGEAIERSRAIDLSSFLVRNLGSVYVNDLQNNPLQPDINYRGFTASPLLGTAQGLSLYVDGVRFNQPFGDVVSWDLIPRQAIADVTLAPGSNPLFGLNTLGGALSVRTKDGRTTPGAEVHLGYGSYDRRLAEVEVGASGGGFDAYATVSSFKDDGWRDYSPTEALQAFGKLGWSNDATRVALSGAYANTDLTGNGLQEQRALARDRSSVYSNPDATRNLSGLANLTFEHDTGGALSLSGNAYWRNIRTRTLNGDVNDETLTESVYQPNAAEQAALRAAGVTGFPTAGESAANTPFPRFRCIANVLLNSEPGEKCNGVLNRTASRQREGGAALQGVLKSDLGDRTNQFTFGAAYKESRVRFAQSTQYGYLTPSLGVIGVNGPGAFADGTQDSENADDARVDLTGRTRTASVYASNTLSVTPALALTLSGRFDADHIKSFDGLNPGGGPGSLDGDHKFNRFNPAVGLTWNPVGGVGAYAGFAQGGRSPSVIELGCADPDNPCRLPNAMAGDPPLDQVRTRTVEFGLRGGEPNLRWRAGLFRADNKDDILFVADDISGFGYFKNFGGTRRQGVELGLDGRAGRISFGADYTFLDATYRSEEEVGGAGNSTNEEGPGFEGAIEIEPGDRIPLIPRHLFKAQVRWEATSQLSFDADMLASSGVFARGNENNDHQPDGVYYLGPGKTKAYATFNLGAEYRPVPPLKLFVQVTNLFDADYENAAQLGATALDANGNFLARPFAGPIVDGERPTRNATFYAPGAPRMVWVGLRYAFGR